MFSVSSSIRPAHPEAGPGFADFRCLLIPVNYGGFWHGPLSGIQNRAGRLSQAMRQSPFEKRSGQAAFTLYSLHKTGGISPALDKGDRDDRKAS